MGVGGVADDGIPSVGREAICVGAVDRPMNEDVPPGRYWPGGVSMRTVAAATVAGLTGVAFDCGPIGMVAVDGVTVGVAGGWKSCVAPVAGAVPIGDTAGIVSP